MRRLFLGLVRQALAPRAARFRRALEDPERAQRKLLEDFYPLSRTRAHPPTPSWKDPDCFRKLPLRSYQDLAPTLEALRARGQGLTPEPVSAWERTSGSGGASKWIPYPPALRRAFTGMVSVWAHDLLRHPPGFSSGKVYVLTTPPLDRDAEAGFEDDADYLKGWVRWALEPFLVRVPGSLRGLSGAEFRRRLARTLLEEADLEAISIWNPSLWTSLLDEILREAEELALELSSKTAQRLLQLDPERPDWSQIWPQLRLISCWDQVHAKAGAQDLRKRFPEVLVQGKGLMATEGPVTLPLIGVEGQVPLLDEVVLEFRDAAGDLFWLWEIEEGETYEVILTQPGGLFRYPLGDRVQVVGRLSRTPLLAFVGRSDRGLDLVGEKLTPELVRPLLEELAPEAGFRTLAAIAFEPPQYCLFLDQHPAPERLATALEAGLREQYHYRLARELGQLGPAKVAVDPRSPIRFQELSRARGIRLGDQKHPDLFPTPLPPSSC